MCLHWLPFFFRKDVMRLYLTIIFLLFGCGSNGPQGKSGNSCTVVQLTNGAQVICTDGSTANIVNGETGLTGIQGPQGTQGTPGYLSPYTIMTIIEPCGHNSSPYKEALLGFLNGQIYVSFSATGSALTVRNTILPDGNYNNTDDSHCWFYLSTNGSGDRSITWAGGGAAYNAATQSWSNL